MKDSRSNTFSKAIITIDEETGDFIIEEIGKDESIVNNLSEIIKQWVGVDGVSISIKRDVVSDSNM